MRSSLLSACLVLSLMLSLGQSGSTQPPAPDYIRAFGDKINAKVKPLLEKALGPLQFQQTTGMGGKGKIGPATVVTLIYQAAGNPPDQSGLEPKLKDVIKQLGAAYTSTDASGGALNVRCKDLKIEDVTAMGHISVYLRTVTFGMTILKSATEYSAS